MTGHDKLDKFIEGGYFNQSVKFLFLCHLHTQPARKGL